MMSEVSGIHAYLPRTFGGGGKKPPFNNDNFISYTKTWKTGLYTGTIASLFTTFVRYVGARSLGKAGKLPDILENFTSHNMVFTDWLKGRGVLVCTKGYDLPFEPIDTFNFDSQHADILSLLIEDGRLANLSQMILAKEHNDRALALQSKVEFTTTMEFLSIMRKNSKAQNCFTVTGQIFDLELTPLIVKRTLSYCDKYRNIRRMLTSEPVFRYEDYETLYSKGIMNVKRLTLEPCFESSKLHFDLDSNCLRPRRAYDDLWNWYQNKIGPPPRELLEDDNIIKQEIGIEQMPEICIITDDTRLCREIAIEHYMLVEQVFVEDHYFLLLGGHDQDYLDKPHKFDEGSNQAFLEKALMMDNEIYINLPVATGSDTLLTKRVYEDEYIPHLKTSLRGRRTFNGRTVEGRARLRSVY